MSTDYNDVDKLLSHIHLDNFAYRSFRKNDSAAPAAEPVAPAVAVPPPVAAAPAPIPAPALRVVRPAEPAAPKQAEPVAAAPAATPAAAAVAAAPAPSVAEASSDIGGTLARLMRGSITDSAPKLHLDLHLPVRPAQGEAEAPAAEGERKLSDVFGRLHTAAAVKPRVVSGTER
jgi:translation initiation factor IF-2